MSIPTSLLDANMPHPSRARLYCGDIRSKPVEPGPGEETAGEEPSTRRTDWAFDMEGRSGDAKAALNEVMNHQVYLDCRGWSTLPLKHNAGPDRDRTRVSTV